jgi:enoyl-CoA hydratase/carnithine racemase
MSNIITERAGSIYRIELNRPGKKNAITNAMYDDLTEAIQYAESDPALRVLLLHGAGDSFSAGNDLQDFLQNPPKSEDSPVGRFISTLAVARKPLVAAVHGAAVGIGATMLLHCDAVFAADNTRFQMPFVNLALAPEVGSTYLLPMLVGYQRAAQWVLFGEPFDAATAQRFGLVAQVVPVDRVLSTATDAAQRLAAKPAAALRACKSLLKRSFVPDTHAAILEAYKVFIEELQSAEAREAYNAFLEKRRPDFTKFA